MVGDHATRVAKHIHSPATALFHSTTVADLSVLDVSYTPPFGNPDLR
jgi:hypothetical protein